MKRIITLSIALAIALVAQAQHHAEEASHTEESHAVVHHSDDAHTDHGHEIVHHGKHKLALYGGFTHIDAAFYEHETQEQSTGKWVPTLGIDYFYALNDKFDVGFIGDIELDGYYIKHEDSNDLERNNVLVLTPVGKYKATHALGFVLGGGVEIEFSSHVKYLAVIKAAIEYEVPISNGWEFAPSVAYDYKKEYSTLAFGMSFGKRF